jgi:hypothetical protein
MLGLCGAVAVAGLIQAQQPPSGSSGPPVTIEFRAVTSDGRPSLDVRPEDVTLKVDGRERALQSTTLVQPGGSRHRASPADQPPPFATNAREGNAGDTMVIIDDESIQSGAETPMRDAAQQFIERLPEYSRAGVVSIPRGGVNLGLTLDRAATRAALVRVTGWARREETDAEAACRTRTILGSLANVFHDAAGGPPLTMVFFSGGLTPPMVDGVSRMSTPTGLCDIRAKDYSDLELALLASPLTVYVVYVPDPATPGAAASFSQVTGLEHLAGVTGNPMVRLVGDHAGALARLASVSAASYHAVFIPEDAERNGRTHRLSVQVNRPGIEVMARPSVLIPSAAGPARAKAPAPRDMLRVAQVYRELPLRAAAFVSRDESADRVRVAVILERIGAGAPLKSAAVGLYDEKGKLAVQATAEPADLAPTPPTIGTVAKPGAYRMRVAATDAAGAPGTADTDVRLELTGSAGLRVSSLVLGVIEAGNFTPRLQFSDEQSAVAYVEIYGVPNGGLSATLELADAESGPAGAGGAMQIQGEAAGDRHVAMASIPVGALPSGDVVVRAVINLNGAPVGRVTRTLRKTAK